jgi:hypothetical protein
VALREAVDPIAHLDGPMLLGQAETDTLQEGRLLALLLKMQMSRCAEMVSSSLGRSLDPRAQVVASLTNGRGLVEWFTHGTQARHFGWQAQGRQFRLVGIAGGQDPKTRQGREQVMLDQHLDYFDFSLPVDFEDLLLPYHGKKDWLGFEPDFVYRYSFLRPDISWRQFIDIAEWFSRRAHTYARKQEIPATCPCDRCGTAS